MPIWVWCQLEVHWYLLFAFQSLFFPLLLNLPPFLEWGTWSPVASWILMQLGPFSHLPFLYFETFYPILFNVSHFFFQFLLHCTCNLLYQQGQICVNCFPQLMLAAAGHFMCNLCPVSLLSIACLGGWEGFPTDVIPVLVGASSVTEVLLHWKLWFAFTCCASFNWFFFFFLPFASSQCDAPVFPLSSTFSFLDESSIPSVM